MTDHERFSAFYGALEARHLKDLTFPEVRRALTALSAIYVERRDKLPGGAVFDGAGKRAAFALFYGPLHFLVVREVVRRVGAATSPTSRIVDLGGGTGVCGAAWALEMTPFAALTNVDVNRWVVDEARWTYQHFGLKGDAHAGDMRKARWSDGDALLCAYSLNELSDADRDALLSRLVAAANKGARVLVIEPIAKRDRPWWPAWQERVVSEGGRSDEWRFRVELPERLRLLDKAAGLHHDELTARSFFLPGQSVTPQ